jgi:hypothetical protein
MGATALSATPAVILVTSGRRLVVRTTASDGPSVCGAMRPVDTWPNDRRLPEIVGLRISHFVVAWERMYEGGGCRGSPSYI